MLVEATEGPVRYRLRDGREIVLRPGVPVELRPELAEKLLAKVGPKVRVVSRLPILPEGHSISWHAADTAPALGGPPAGLWGPPGHGDLRDPVCSSRSGGGPLV